MSFTKLFKAGSQNVKMTASRMIKEDMTFSCQVADIKTTNGDETVYPESTDINRWLQQLFSKDLKSKPLNERALAAMAKKGITPQKQVLEILLIVIVASETHVHLGMSVPKIVDSEDSKYQDIDPIELSKSFVDENEQKCDFDTCVDYTILAYEHDSPLKEKDELQRRVFAQLKEQGIYVAEEEEDDEIYEFDI
jgi:hypothetical protein